jgi:hypothetical protein
MSLANEVRELSSSEIDEVSGALVWKLALACYASTACKVGVVAAAGVISAAVGYENNRE